MLACWVRWQRRQQKHQVTLATERVRGAATILDTTARVCLQEKLSFDPLDCTTVWPEEDYPLREVGRMTLKRNPKNFFAENEQVRHASLARALRSLCFESYGFGTAVRVVRLIANSSLSSEACTPTEAQRDAR